MIKDKLKKEKGISLVSLTIAVVVLLILTNIIIYNIKDNLKVGKLREMQNDVGNLRDKISAYYTVNGKIPARLVYNNSEAIDQIKSTGVISNNVDTGDFLVIDLAALENLTLNRGKDYETIKNLATLTEEQAKQYTDLYIINEVSHNIFYVAGVTIDNDTFYTDYEAVDADKASVNLKYVDNVKIPEGFYYVGGTKDTGLVISDVSGDDLENSKQGNQFVWVPVENMNDFYTVEGYASGQLQTRLGNCQEPYTNGYEGEISEYDAMKKSVEINKGFYIGRFEAGNDGAGNVVVKKGANVYNNVPWGNSVTDIENTTNTQGKTGAVKLAKNFTSGKTSYNNSVTSTLCYGVQWDTALEFIDPSYDSFVKDSTKQGWHKQNYNSTEQGNIGTNPSNITGLDLIYNDKPNVIANQQKNIYDMAGNVWEWTMEFCGADKRTNRGGGYNQAGDAYAASFRNAYDSISKDFNDSLGFRVTLYVNSEEENWSPVYDKQGIYKDKNGDVAYIQQDFKVSKKNGEDTIKEGLVVKDLNGNEFVWVPVKDDNNFKRVAGYSNGTLQDLTNYTEPYANGYQEEETDYHKMVESVKNKHGFYIGRYEAGKDNSGNVIVQKGVSVYNNVPWGNSMTDIEGTSNTNGRTGVAKLAKDFAQNKGYKGVTSTLCYGVQWDTALKFIDPSYTGFAKDSTKQGWYKDNYNSTEQGNREVNPNHITGLDLVYNNKPNVIANKQKNIYDMAGNMFECTMEACEADTRAIRGGSWNDDGFSYSASRRHGGGLDVAIESRGFRITLYLSD